MLGPRERSQSFEIAEGMLRVRGALAVGSSPYAACGLQQPKQERTLQMFFKHVQALGLGAAVVLAHWWFVFPTVISSPGWFARPLSWSFSLAALQRTRQGQFISLPAANCMSVCLIGMNSFKILAAIHVIQSIGAGLGTSKVSFET